MNYVSINISQLYKHISSIKKALANGIKVHVSVKRNDLFELVSLDRKPVSLDELDGMQIDNVSTKSGNVLVKSVPTMVQTPVNRPSKLVKRPLDVNYLEMEATKPPSGSPKWLNSCSRIGDEPYYCVDEKDDETGSYTRWIGYEEFTARMRAEDPDLGNDDEVARILAEKVEQKLREGS